MHTELAPRVVPLLPPEWDETARDALGAFPKSLQFALNAWDAGGGDARGINTLGAMAHFPPLAKAFMTLNAHVAGASSLTVRVRELVILRTAWLGYSEYELVQHLVLGRRAGLTEVELERIWDGPDAEGWDPIDADLLRAVDELHSLSRIGDETWTRLSQHFNNVQLMDLIFLVGCYSLLGTAINTLHIPIEPCLSPLDPALRARMYASQSRK